MIAAFIKLLNEKGHIDFSYLKGFDFHEYPLTSLMRSNPWVEQQGSKITLHIYVTSETVKLYSRFVIGYYFEVILLYGDVTKDKGLEVDSVVSSLYAFSDENEGICDFNLYLPDCSFRWMVMLKVSCQEENRMAVSEKRYGMRVVGVN